MLPCLTDPEVSPLKWVWGNAGRAIGLRERFAEASDKSAKRRFRALRRSTSLT